jgi:hypothetical protein
MKKIVKYRKMFLKRALLKMVPKEGGVAASEA